MDENKQLSVKKDYGILYSSQLLSPSEFWHNVNKNPLFFFLLLSSGHGSTCCSVASGDILYFSSWQQTCVQTQTINERLLLTGLVCQSLICQIPPLKTPQRATLADKNLPAETFCLQNDSLKSNFQNISTVLIFENIKVSLPFILEQQLGLKV